MRQPPEFPASDGLPMPQRAWAMLAMAISVGVAVFDSSIANIALPTISHDLHISPASSVWVVNAYQIAVMVSLLPCSSLGDIYGYRRVYGIGLAIFTAASVACALSDSLGMLVAARVLQGFGGAGIMSVNTALVRYIFPRAKLGTGLGFNALIVATASAIGPSLGAGILSIATWPYLFAINLPLGLLALAMQRNLPMSPRSGHRFDFLSAALSAVTFGLLVSAVGELGHGQILWISLLQVGVSLGIGYVFVKRQLVVPAPMLPIEAFRRPVFTLSVITSMCSFCGQTMAMVALPFLFQAGSGLTDVQTGLMMSPWPAAVAVMAPISGRLSDRFPAGLLGAIGLALMATGLLSLALLPMHPAWWDVAWRMSLTGIGFGLFQSPNNRLLLSSVPRERSGTGSGMLSSARLTGQSFGAGLAAVAFGLNEAAGAGQGAFIAVLVAAGFAAIGAAFSSLRLVATAKES